MVSHHFNVLAGERVVGRQPHSGARRYYHTDLLGSTRAVVEGTTVVESYDYDPWGLLLAGRTLGSGTKEGFTSKERDAESGLDYFGARYYMPALGRWTSGDPLADRFPGWSPYNYTLNNPIALTDPDGNAPDCKQNRWLCAFELFGQLVASFHGAPAQPPTRTGPPVLTSAPVEAEAARRSGELAQRLEQLVQDANNTSGASTVEPNVPQLPRENIRPVRAPREPTPLMPKYDGPYQRFRVGNRWLMRSIAPLGIGAEVLHTAEAYREANRINISIWTYLSAQMLGMTPEEIERAVELNRPPDA